MSKKKKDNSDLFDESERKESYMSLEVREKRRCCAVTFENLKAQHQQYLNEHGRTWLGR